MDEPDVYPRAPVGQADVADSEKLVPEGIEGRVAYKGTIAEMTTQLVGGLRSGMGYTGCRTIKEFQVRWSCRVSDGRPIHRMLPRPVE